MPKPTDISALKSIGTVAQVPAPLVPAALRPGDEPVVVGVAADPYPIDGAALAPPDGAPAPPDADGMDVLEPLHGLEMEPRVPGVGLPTPERLGRETLNIDRQGIEAFPELLRRRRFHFRFGNSSGNTSPASISASARATMASSTGRVWANFFAQRASSAISSRIPNSALELGAVAFPAEPPPLSSPSSSPPCVAFARPALRSRAQPQRKPT